MVELKKHLEIVLFHVRFWLKEYGMTLENCLQSNITKLQKRFPEKFSAELAMAKGDEQ